MNPSHMFGDCEGLLQITHFEQVLKQHIEDVLLVQMHLFHVMLVEREIQVVPDSL